MRRGVTCQLAHLGAQLRARGEIHVKDGNFRFFATELRAVEKVDEPKGKKRKNEDEDKIVFIERREDEDYILQLGAFLDYVQKTGMFEGTEMSVDGGEVKKVTNSRELWAKVTSDRDKFCWLLLNSIQPVALEFVSAEVCMFTSPLH